MDGGTDIQRGKTEFERAAAVDRSREPQHSLVFSEDAGDGERLDALRARLTPEAPELVAASSSSPRLVETRHIALTP